MQSLRASNLGGRLWMLCMQILSPQKLHQISPRDATPVSPWSPSRFRSIGGAKCNVCHGFLLQWMQIQPQHGLHSFNIFGIPGKVYGCLDCLFFLPWTIIFCCRNCHMKDGPCKACDESVRCLTWRWLEQSCSFLVHFALSYATTCPPRTSFFFTY